MSDDTKKWEDMTEAEKAAEQRKHAPSTAPVGNRKLRRKVAAVKRRANRKARKEDV